MSKLIQPSVPGFVQWVEIISEVYFCTVGNNLPQVPILEWNCQYLAVKYHRKGPQLTSKTV